MKTGIRKIPLRMLDYYTGSLEKNSIEYWQLFIFHVLAFSGTVFGTLSLVSASGVLIWKGRLSAVAILTVLYAINLFAIFARRFPIKAKTLVIALNFYLFGVVSLAVAGPVGESGIWFSVSVLMCSLFIGFKTAFGFALLNFLTGITFGLLHSRGLIVWAMLREVPFSSWLVQSGNIFFVGMMFAVANTMLIKGVGYTFRHLNESEARTRVALAEKETLLRELYHRTKNNMQVVSSLLILHSKELESEDAKAVFKDVVNKIGAMSLVHQKLYESKDLSNINLADYIGDLVSLLMKSYGMSAERIEIALDLQAATTLIDTAVPCGLVVSEIVANSFKHAFPDGRRGRIGISLKQAEEDYIEIRISDDGVGLAEGFQVGVNGRMGMKTLFNMVNHQLRGSIQLSSTGGVAYTVRFKGNLYDQRVRSDG